MTNQRAIEELARRLDTLDRENRRLKTGAALVLVGMAAVGIMGQARPRTVPRVPSTVVEAERFVLRSARGQVGAVLSWEASEGPRLALHDRSGTPRLTVALGFTGSPSLTLLEQDGKTSRATLAVGIDDAPGLALFDRDGKPRATLAVFRKGARLDPGPAAGGDTSPALALYDRAGRPRAAVTVTESHGASLDLSDSEGQLRAGFDVRADGTPRLRLHDREGRGRAGLTVLHDGTPALNLYAGDGAARAVLTIVPGGGAGIALADRDGSVVWSAP